MENFLGYGLANSAYDGKRHVHMTRSVNEVFAWAKQQGCTDIYAVSEIYNEGSHSIFKKVKYQVEITQNYMSDEHSGFRLMYNYHVSL